MQARVDKLDQPLPGLQSRMNGSGVPWAIVRLLREQALASGYAVVDQTSVMAASGRGDQHPGRASTCSVCWRRCCPNWWCSPRGKCRRRFRCSRWE